MLAVDIDTMANIPVRVIGQHHDGLAGFPRVPELGFTVVAAARQVILLVWVKVQVSH